MEVWTNFEISRKTKMNWGRFNKSLISVHDHVIDKLSETVSKRFRKWFRSLMVDNIGLFIIIKATTEASLRANKPRNSINRSFFVNRLLFHFEEMKVDQKQEEFKRVHDHMIDKQSEMVSETVSAKPAFGPPSII